MRISLRASRRRGLPIGKAGLHHNVVCVAPHLTVDAEDIDFGVARLARARVDAAG